MNKKELILLASSPQNLVLSVLYSLLAVGILYLQFEITWLAVALAASTAVLSELMFSRIVRGSFSFPTSALIAAAGICIFFRSTEVYYFALAAFLAVASKYVIRGWSGVHIFNPSNFAIVVIVFLFPAATTIEFTQWGNNLVLYAIIAALCLFVSYRAGKLRTTVSFFVSYTTLLLLILPHAPETLQAHHYGVLGPSLLLFASFMITDPRTSPRGHGEMILHGVSVALLFFLLEVAGVRYSLFVASFLVTVLNVPSKWVSNFFRPQFAMLRYANAASSIFVASVAAFVFVPMLQSPQRFSSLSLSPEFIALGVESKSLLRCDVNAPLHESENTHLGDGLGTYGAAWGDYDNDGFDDIFVSSIGGVPSRLYKNNGDGTFIDVTKRAGLPTGYSSSAFFVDVDNDGLLDIFIFYESDAPTYSLADNDIGMERSVSISLYKNSGDNTFYNISKTVGLANLKWNDGLMATASFADYDVDGDLDVVVATRGHLAILKTAPKSMMKSFYDPFFNQSRTAVCDADSAIRALSGISAGETSGIDDAVLHKLLADGGCLYLRDSIELFANMYPFAAPSFMGTSPNLQINIPGTLHILENRDGVFVEHQGFYDMVKKEITKNSVTLLREGTSPYGAVSGRFYQPVSFDYDSDGRPDIFAASSRGSPLLLRNEGNLTFSVQTVEAGLDKSGDAMGVDIGDYNNDGFFDVVFTNLRSDFLYSGTPKSAFTLSQNHLGELGLGWGISFLDYNLDGWDDIIETNGVFFGMHESPNYSYILPFFRTDRLYRNNRLGEFEDRTWSDFCPGIESGRALAISDYDNNGTPDVFIGNVFVEGETSKNKFYVNSTTGASYIKIRLEGARSNSFGVGAEVQVTAGTSTQTKVVLVGNSFYSQNSTRLVFGLGAYPVDGMVHVRVAWPSGTVTDTEYVGINREMVVRESL